MQLPFLTIIVLVIFVLSSAIRILKEYERGVIFRLGRLINAKGLMDVPPQDIITRDNVSVKVNAVVYFRVLDPSKAIVEVEDFTYATSQLSQTTLRSILGEAELDELLSSRDKINQKLQSIIDTQTDPWGIKVSQVEIKHVDLPTEMQRAMAKQAEAERERRAKIINAEGEYQASARLLEAGEVLSKEPITVQLRFLQTLREVATENNSTIIFPIPIDLFKPFIKMLEKNDKEV
jgi:regulator of protease activity HflC (stomatin/prohibitin superfamily)